MHHHTSILLETEKSVNNNNKVKIIAPEMHNSIQFLTETSYKDGKSEYLLSAKWVPPDSYVTPSPCLEVNIFTRSTMYPSGLCFNNLIVL